MFIFIILLLVAGFRVQGSGFRVHSSEVQGFVFCVFKSEIRNPKSKIEGLVTNFSPLLYSF
jgi:hypothetical protein